MGLDESAWIELGCVLVGKYRNMNSPDIIIVLGNHRSKRRLVMPGDAPALKQISLGRSKVDHVEFADARLSLQLDAQPRPNAAGTAVAADKILTAYLFLGASPLVPQDRDDTMIFLFKTFEGDAEPHLDFRKGVDGFLQNGLDLDL